MVKEDSAEFLGIVLWVYISQSFLIPKLYSTQDTEIVKKIKACMDPIENKLSVCHFSRYAQGCNIVGEKSGKQVKKTQWQDNVMRHCTVLFQLIFPTNTNQEPCSVHFLAKQYTLVWNPAWFHEVQPVALESYSQAQNWHQRTLSFTCFGHFTWYCLSSQVTTWKQ